MENKEPTDLKKTYDLSKQLKCDREEWHETFVFVSSILKTKAGNNTRDFEKSHKLKSIQFKITIYDTIWTYYK